MQKQRQNLSRKRDNHSTFEAVKSNYNSKEGNNRVSRINVSEFITGQEGILKLQIQNTVELII